MRTNWKMLESDKEYMRNWRYSKIGTIPKKRAFAIIKRSKKKTNQFLSKYKGFYKCKDCNGIGFHSLEMGDGNMISLSYCRDCDRTGVVDWVSNVIGG